MAQEVSTQTIQVRLLPHQRRRVERAASIDRASLSDFIVQKADEAAIRTIEQHESWTLSEAGRDAFFEALANPH